MTDVQLVRFENAKRALQEARTIDEIKDVRDKAEALRLYMRQAGESLEMQNAVAEIKIRAERKAGELLKDMDRARPGDFHGNQFGKSHDVTNLTDLGVSKMQSSRWQSIADIPDEKFEQHIQRTREAQQELTTASTLRLADHLKNGNDTPLDYDLVDEYGVITEHPSGKQKPKINRAGDIYIPQGFDACQTPAYALDPLLPYLNRDWTIWEPAQGKGRIVEALYDSGYSQNAVVGSDLLTGQNFFEYQPDQHWDCLVTNPPYSIKYKWLEHCYSLGKPFALLIPVETLGAKTAQAFFRTQGIEVIFLDQRVNFEMPNIGLEGSSAQFPVAWFTWGLCIGQQMTFAEVKRRD